MKKSLQEKFRNKINFVKPLYRNRSDQVSNKIIPFKDRILKRGEFDVKTAGSYIINVNNNVCEEYKVRLPGNCDSVYTKNRGYNNLQTHSKIENLKYKNGVVAEDNTKVICNKVPDTYLRVYPAPKILDETTCSIIIRCMICQFGITTFLILWTIFSVFTIQHFEGPHEEKVTKEFEKDQKQLVIDLATELRQITPLSPKWRLAIERRINDERKLTMTAVGNGANIMSGQLWNLSGTFLFCVYVMTALGFGAPVPHTIWGKTCALIYAILAIPTHIYLMLNAGTCFVIKMESCMQLLRKRNEKVTSDKRSPVNCKQFDASKQYDDSIPKSISLWLGKSYIICGLPVSICFYYVLGVLVFGVIRTKNVKDSLLFPREFTTTGGLELVHSSTRVLYSLYIEGFMCLLACTLATIRRYSTHAVMDLANHYRLLLTDR